MAETFEDVRRSVQALYAGFPGAYGREFDTERRCPEALVRSLTEAGFLATLIPEAYGGSGLGMAATEAAALMVEKAAAMFDGGEACGPEASMSKPLAADASGQAADMCLQTHFGFGFAEEYDVERKFRETRLYQVAPISTNLILAYLGEPVLGLPRSYG